MPGRINPRPLFRRTIDMLAAAECPQCGKVLGARHLDLGKPDYYCRWCKAREQAVEDYRAWQRQDAAERRAAKK